MVTAEPQQQQQHFVDGETGNGTERGKECRLFYDAVSWELPTRH